MMRRIPFSMRYFFPTSAIFVALTIWINSSLLESLVDRDGTVDASSLKKSNHRTNADAETRTNPVVVKDINTSTNHPQDSATSLKHELFHFIFTTSADTIHWRVIKALEAVFYHHPHAKVIVHSQTIPEKGTDFDKFQDAKYNLSVQNYSFEELLNKSMTFLSKNQIQSFLNVIQERKKQKFWYSHSTDILRLILLEQYGGVYLDTDIHLIQPITRELQNVLGFQGNGRDKVNGAVMIFDAHNSFIQSCLSDALSIASKPYDQRLWEIFGPQLLTRHWNEWKNQSSVIKAVPMHVFYPYGIYKTKQCFITPKETFNPIKDSTVAVHLNTGVTRDYNYTLAGTVCDEMFKQNCIFCDFQHTLLVKNGTNF